MHSPKTLLYILTFLFGVHLLDHSIDFVANSFAPAVMGWMFSHLILSWVYDR